MSDDKPRSETYRIVRRHVILQWDARPGSTVQVCSATYAPPHETMTDPPRMSLPFGDLTRIEWENLKRLGDEAWAIYERDHGKGGRFA